MKAKLIIWLGKYGKQDYFVGYLLISDFFPVTNYRFGSADICNLSIIIPLFLIKSVRYIAMVEQCVFSDSDSDSHLLINVRIGKKNGRFHTVAVKIAV